MKISANYAPAPIYAQNSQTIKYILQNPIQDQSQNLVQNLIQKEILPNFALSFKGSPKIAHYAVDMDGNFQRFNSTVEASKKLNIPNQNISLCLSGKTNTSNGYAFVKAQDVEKQEGDKIKLDKKKLSEIAISKSHAVYVFDRQGNIEKFPNGKEAAQKLDISYAKLVAHTTSKTETQDGRFFIKAYEIDIADDNGRIFPDKVKIGNIIHENDTSAIYAVDKDRNYIKFNSPQQAAKQLNQTSQYIADSVSLSLSSVSGYVFVRAKDVEEVDENGEIVLNKQKLINAAILQDRHSIYALSQDGTLTKFPNSKEASSNLDISQSNISTCLNKNKISKLGYRFARACEIETADKNGIVYVDREKLDKILKAQANKKEKRKTIDYIA